MKNIKAEIVITGLLCMAAVAHAEPNEIGFGKGNDPQAGKPDQDVEWVTINGGEFTMGTDSSFDDEKPIHEVTIKTFEMSKTHVTVEQYEECVVKGQCSKPGTTSAYCNWDKPSRKRYPVNCVSWDQANQYAKFKGGRLPSESEWEYAATSGGKNQKYPWGNEDATCERAVMYRNGFGCGNGGTMPVCSKPEGNSAQGLCDMVGNVWQWTQDWYHLSYLGAPLDGSAWESPTGSYRVIRGGSFFDDARDLRADYRLFGDSGYPYTRIGFRLARSSR